MSSRPDLSALDVLVLVAETGSLGAAARRLGMAQPNASRALARLERQLGLSLVVRTPGGSRVTTEGEVIVTWAREALGAVDRMILGARSLVAERGGALDRGREPYDRGVSCPALAGPVPPGIP